MAKGEARRGLFEKMYLDGLFCAWVEMKDGKLISCGEYRLTGWGFCERHHKEDLNGKG